MEFSDTDLVVIFFLCVLTAYLIYLIRITLRENKPASFKPSLNIEELESVNTMDSQPIPDYPQQEYIYPPQAQAQPPPPQQAPQPQPQPQPQQPQLTDAQRQEIALNFWKRIALDSFIIFDTFVKSGFTRAEAIELTKLFLEGKVKLER